jgi:hypothetical protein
LQLINPSTSSNELNTTLTPHSITHGDACFAYFNKIWGIPLGQGQRAVGPKHSINILGGQSVWLYKTGGPGRELGTIDRCGPDEIQILLQNAAEEFGRLVGWQRRRQHGSC